LVGIAGLALSSGQAALAQTTDVLVFSRTKGGLYGGLNLEGAIIKPRHEWNNQYYAAQVNRPSDIIIQHKVENPQADPLRQTVARVARR
jgi:lipid-binding SYLF domain-containing protein